MRRARADDRAVLEREGSGPDIPQRDRFRGQASGLPAIDAQAIDAQAVHAEAIHTQTIDAQTVHAEPVDAEPVDAQPIHTEAVHAQAVGRLVGYGARCRKGDGGPERQDMKARKHDLLHERDLEWTLPAQPHGYANAEEYILDNVTVKLSCYITPLHGFEIFEIHLQITSSEELSILNCIACPVPWALTAH